MQQYAVIVAGVSKRGEAEFLPEGKYLSGRVYCHLFGHDLSAIVKA